LNFLTKGETKEIINEFHKGICEGHHACRTNAYKILKVGYYWPSVFSDVNCMVRACAECQMFAGKWKLKPLSLDHITSETPFQQGGLYFTGEIHPNSSGHHKWILTATYYFTKWVEETPAKSATDSFIIKFLEENILSRFGCPQNIITDNA
jgi:hypothetical protein